jgi:cysteinyl-tRNA synthetase
VDVAPYKKNPMDFVLWKPSTPEQPGWHSPWGRGRPGWHIECSAMSETLLGESFDIHGGGVDLVFPHHENEIAQSEGAHHGHPLARVWMHNGFLQVEGEKMAKSLGNFVTINELLNGANFGGRRWAGEVIRLAMLKTHYRQPIDWTVRTLSEAEATLNRWYECVGDVKPSEPAQSVLKALMDDMNSAQVVSDLHQLVGGSPVGLLLTLTHAAQPETLKASANLLGLLMMSETDWKSQRVASLTSVDIGNVQALIEARNEARKAKNFKESDRIRDELLAKRIILKDGPTGTTWEVKR